MVANEKVVFIFLCLVMIAVNGYLHAGAGSVTSVGVIYRGIGGSLISIPLWSCIGVLLGSIGLFFWRLIKPEQEDSLSMWQKASLGLIVGISVKAIFGIVV